MIDKPHAEPWLSRLRSGPVYFSLAPSGTNTPPNLSAMTPDGGVMNVGTMNGGATTPQFSIKTTTSALDPIEFIAIKADCTYLLLNSITAHTPSVPEPRFYGFLLAGLFGVVGAIYQRRRSASQPV